MVGQGAGPGVPDRQDTAQTADLMRVRGKLEERLGRRAEPDVVEVSWIAPDALTERVGHGEDHVHGGDRQAFRPSRCEPGVGVAARTARAAAVAAGVVDIGLRPTRVARPQVSD